MTNRAVSVVLFGLGAAFLFGCPIYSERYYDDCWDGSSCGGSYCAYDDECPSGYLCASDGRCRRPTGASSSCTSSSDCDNGDTCGADNKCHPSDCSVVGCAAPRVCRLSSGAGGVPACVLPDSTQPDGGGIVSTCRKDSDCPTPAGSKCLSGACVAPQDQCADATQCQGGAQCVEGTCTPSCDASKPCPTGFACDATKGVCTNNPSPCTDSSQCTGGTVCSQEHCVTPCGSGGSCAAGLVCVDGGCVPTEKPVFTCNVEGVRDACQQGSLCLRHSCYIACDADAGTEACKNADTFNQCKSVTTSSGSYSVCGSTSNLGTECDPTQSKACSGAEQICIDGYCK